MEPLRPDDPRQVGPYRLERRLGGGGMGQVYLGRSPGGRPVAVKVVRPELADDADFRRRFAVEVEAARQVGGFYTAQVVDADPDANPPWLVTAYIPGPSLQQAIDAHGPLPAESVATLGAGLAEGLAAVHAAGLAHRDLKPGNVLLAADGPRVIDFGIARAMDATSHTATSQIIGTPAFMSPEQLRGGEVDQRTDVFSLGTVLVYAATGQGPFGTGPSQGIMYRIVNEEPDVSDLPASLAELVTACLAKDPADRPGLTDIIDRLATPARTATQWLPPDVTLMITKQADEAEIPATGDTEFATAEPAPASPKPYPRPAPAPRAPAPSPPGPAAAPQQRGTLLIGNLSPAGLDVIVDGAVIGTVHANSQYAFPVAPGAHSLQAKAGAVSSTARRTEVAPGITTRVAYSIPRSRTNRGPGTAPEMTESVTFTIYTSAPRPAKGTGRGSARAVVVPLSGGSLAATDASAGTWAGMLFVLLVLALMVSGTIKQIFHQERLILSSGKFTFEGENRPTETVRCGDLAQVSVIGGGRDAELVIWPRDGSPNAPCTVFCEVGKFTRKYSLEEIRAAVRFFAGDRYVEQPG